MDRFHLLKEIVTRKELLRLSMMKIIMSIASLMVKYIMMVYLFDQVLNCISNSKRYSDFLIIVVVNAGCVAIRLIIQNTESYYLNDTLKFSLESVFVGKLFQCFRKEPIYAMKENKAENEYKVNFIKENTYTVIDNLGLSIANVFLLFLSFLYMAKFSYTYLVIVAFPLMSIFFNRIIARTEVKMSKKEAGVLQAIREIKKITDHKDALNLFCNFSLFTAFGQYKNIEFKKSIDLNKKSRWKVCIFSLIASLFRVCAVFFVAVLISIRLAGRGIMKPTDIVVVISACHLMAGAVSVIVSKITQNTELLKTINGIFGEFSEKDILEINEEVYRLKLENVTYKYGESGKEILYNVEIRKGNKVVITGSNGCGKTTLLKMILGYIEPCSGEIRINDKAVKERYHISNTVSVFEPYPLLNVTPAEYVAGGSADIALAAEDGQVMNDLGVDSSKKMNFGSHLSAGTRQALNLIRIIYSRQHLIVLDEPTSKLNEKLALPLIKRILSKDAIVLISTHDENVVSLFQNDSIIRLDSFGAYGERGMA